MAPFEMRMQYTVFMQIFRHRGRRAPPAVRQIVPGQARAAPESCKKHAGIEHGQGGSRPGPEMRARRSAAAWAVVRMVRMVRPVKKRSRRAYRRLNQGSCGGACAAGGAVHARRPAGRAHRPGRPPPTPRMRTGRHMGGADASRPANNGAGRGRTAKGPPGDAGRPGASQHSHRFSTVRQGSPDGPVGGPRGALRRRRHRPPGDRQLRRGGTAAARPP